MLTTSRKQLVEKVIAKDGVIYRVVFAVSNEYGRVKAEIVSATILGNIEEHSEILALPEAKKNAVYAQILQKVFAESVVSAYSDLIYKTGSKPRAPTL
ncbi:MAG TPA: hypothetical protein VEC13_01245 [Candidatus Paceibacterota bacterium]|nr:hypothetical protein [Candidatus Paceibacterota bacterium]